MCRLSSLALSPMVNGSPGLRAWTSDSSEGKERLPGISKRGDAYLRTLLIHGARSVIRTAKDKNDRLSQWVTRLAARRHPNVVAAALASKTTHMAWAMLRNGSDYQPDLVAG